MENTKNYINNIGFLLYKNFKFIILLLGLSIILGISGLVISYEKISLEVDLVYQIAEDWLTLVAIIFTFIMVSQVVKNSHNYNMPIKQNNSATWAVVILFDLLLAILYIGITYLSSLIVYAIGSPNVSGAFFGIKFSHIIASSVELFFYCCSFSSISYLICKMTIINKKLRIWVVVYVIVLLLIYKCIGWTLYEPLHSIIQFFFYEPNVLYLFLKLLPIALASYIVDHVITGRYLCK